MKNLLFLAGLIMVTAACSSGTSGTNMTYKEESKECNYSFVVVRKASNGVCDFAVCKADYDNKAQVLHLCIADGKEFSYPLSQIKDEYIEQVKNNKVTLLFGFGDPMPAVVEKDTSTEEIPGFEKDYRQFTFNSILKDSHASGICQYLLIYNGMFMNGFCKLGDQVLKNGRFFFTESDFLPETTDKSSASKGLFSAGLALYDSANDFFKKDRYGNPYRFSVVQTFYENGYLVICVEDGKTYRYPLKALNPVQRYTLLNEKQPRISAIQLVNRRWIPIYLVQEGEEYRYSGFLWNSSNYYNFYERINSMQIYSDFMLEAGITLNYKPLDFFFYVK